MASSSAHNNNQANKGKILRERSIPESKDGNCVLCCEKAKYFAVGYCDHPVCYKCSARMRVLSKENYCAACRAEIDQVVFCSRLKKFEQFNLKTLSGKRKFGIRFEDKRISESFENLLAYICVECKKDSTKPFLTFQELKSHIRKVHEKQFCQICVENLSLFPCELKLYNRKELVNHRKDGDKDERSHRGHPECRFCRDRFFDNDQLLLHLRKTHFWCHFCEHDGRQEYYNIYKDLRKHFWSDHYLCDEGNCVNEKYTSVFRDKIDYQAHKLAYHGKKLNKFQAKEARKVEIDYHFHNRTKPGAGISGNDYEEVQHDNLKTQRNNNRHSTTSHNARGTVNFQDYEDIAKERQDFHGKSRRHEAEEINSRNINSVAMAASASLSNSDPDIHTRITGSSYDNDDDVIGLSEHVNKHEHYDNKHDGLAASKFSNNYEQNKNAKKNENILDGKIIEKQKKELNYETKVIMEPIDQPKAPVNVVQLKKEEDFPSLPGSAKTSLYTKTTVQIQEDAFPALGQTLKAKDHQPNAAKSKQPWGNHVNGIPNQIHGILIKTKKKSKGKSYSKQTGRMKLDTDVDFPTLNSHDDSAKKRDNERVKLSVPPPDLTNVSKRNTSESLKTAKDRPPPGICNTSGVSKGSPGLSNAPPGFSKIPPGMFKESISDSPPLSNATKDVSKSIPDTSESPSQNLNKEISITKPPGLPSSRDQSNRMERNLRLLAMLQMYLDDFNMKIFKTLSGDFRRGEKSAKAYYSDISELLGDNLQVVFSELVALLPDETKQQELLVARNNAKVLGKQQREERLKLADYSSTKIWSGSAVTKVDEPVESECGQCGARFPKDKANEHMESHAESFPALPTVVKKKNNYAFVPVRKSHVKSAWGK